jgi:hypothetical protein
MVWDGEECPTTLDRSGAYVCRYLSGDYVGWWRFEHGQFEVMEALVLDPLVPPRGTRAEALHVRMRHLQRASPLRDRLARAPRRPNPRPRLQFHVHDTSPSGPARSC